MSSKHGRPAAKHDFAVMGTNNGSIVSKRSVEKLYFTKEPHLLRHFVRKFHRRSPLINRGYWLRMKAVDVVVHQFLETNPDRTRVIINLGCGYDPLPWQCVGRHATASRGAVFIDVDFPNLMKDKRQIVLNNQDLASVFEGLEVADEEPILLRSDQYYQIGCDLRRLRELEQALCSILRDLSKCQFLFVAEVSITYMDRETADALVSWASRFPSAEFCLVEKIMPDGPTHPFARTMLQHFEKRGTPLKSIHDYPTLHSQIQRFRSRGWEAAHGRTLWELWALDNFVSATERVTLAAVEPFDEWEEFALWGCHYCLVLARNTVEVGEITVRENISSAELQSAAVNVRFVASSGDKGLRKFSNGIRFYTDEGISCIFNLLGSGPAARPRTYDIYMSLPGSLPTTDRPTEHLGVNSAHDIELPIPEMCGGPSSRMCFSLTDLSQSRVLLVGGRSSPSQALSDSWLFSRADCSWIRVQDCPTPVYRHSVTRLGNSTMALLLGGRRNATALNHSCFVWHPRHGWTKCHLSSELTSHTLFGANLICTRQRVSSSLIFSGIILGGIGNEGTINMSVIEWTLEIPMEKMEPTIYLSAPLRNTQILEGLAPNMANPLLHRFGASCIFENGNLLLVGGVINCRLLQEREDILALTASGALLSVRIRDTNQTQTNGEVPRPLMIGATVVSTGTHADKFVLLGGGATCYSFGAFWTPGSYSISLPFNRELDLGYLQPEPWIFKRSFNITSNDDGIASRPHAMDSPYDLRRRQPTIISRIKLDSNESFERLVQQSRPVIIEGLDVGSCTKKWSQDYLIAQLGEDRKVIVHDATTDAMDFNTKNFEYRAMGFGQFMRDASNGKKLYLRSLSAERPSEMPANLQSDFPAISEDFLLPAQLSLVTDNAHSAPLRISGPVNMWLHYDVMANVYCQIKGSKRLLCFPPTDVKHFNFAPGSSSSSVDVFSDTSAEAVSPAHPHEAVVNSGDVLFIPALWLHAAAPIECPSVAVNVFFKTLSNGYASGRDVYGNRDIAAYDTGRRSVARIAKSFSQYPCDMQEFYIARLTEELRRSLDK